MLQLTLQLTNNWNRLYHSISKPFITNKCDYADHVFIIY